MAENPELERSLQELEQSVSGVTASAITASQAMDKGTESERRRAQALDDATDKIKKLGAELGGNLKNAAGSLGSSLLDSSRGMSKYSGAVKGLGDAAGVVTKQFGILGGPITLLIKVFAAAVGEVLKLNEQLVNFRDDLSKTTGVLPTTLTELSNLSSQAGYSGERMQVLQKITGSLGKDLVSLGGIAGEGAVKFMKLSDVGDNVRGKFAKLGVSQERLTELQSMYVKYQSESGRALQLQTKTTEQLKQESLAYAENMIRLSSLTGKSADQLAEEQKQAQLTYEEQVKTLQENDKIKQLDAASKKEGISAEEKGRILAQKARIENEQANRKAVMNEITAAYGPKMAQEAGRVLRTGVIDPMSKNMAFLYPGLVNLKKGLGAIDPKEFEKQKIAAKQVDELQKGIHKNASMLGETAQFMGEQQGAILTGGTDILKAENDRSKKWSEMSEDERKARQKKLTEDDKLSDAETNRRNAEIASQKLYQEQLTNLAQVVMPAVSSGFKLLEEAVNGLGKGIDSVVSWLASTWIGKTVGLKAPPKRFEPAAPSGGGATGGATSGGPAASGGATGGATSGGPAASGAAAVIGGDNKTQKGGSVTIGNETREGGTVSWRTNNPGNVSYGDFAKKYGAIGRWINPNGDQQQRTSGIAIMPTLEAGYNMKMGLWRIPKYNNSTIGEGVSMWTGGNQSPLSPYAKDLANAAGASTGTFVGKLSDSQLKSMVKKQTQWEGFKEGKIASAADGGIFTGSASGYPATLHGTEIVAPLNVDSLLMKLAKTPATDSKVMSPNSGGGLEKAVSVNTMALEHMSMKMDKVIAALEQGNSTSKKILQHARV